MVEISSGRSIAESRVRSGPESAEAVETPTATVGLAWFTDHCICLLKCEVFIMICPWFHGLENFHFFFVTLQTLFQLVNNVNNSVAV